MLVLVRRGILHPLEEPAEKGKRYTRGERLRFSVVELDALPELLMRAARTVEGVTQDRKRNAAIGGR
jgi:hypothetical protein